MRSQGPCFVEVHMPHTKDIKMEGKYGGKDAGKSKDGTKASGWRKRRHVHFQSMYEHYDIVPLIMITSMSMKVE